MELYVLYYIVLHQYIIYTTPKYINFFPQHDDTWNLIDDEDPWYLIVKKRASKK